MTEFQPRRHELILAPQEASNTSLGEGAWDEENFEEGGRPEVKTETDRAIAAVEKA
jgi:hypothetical protein